MTACMQYALPYGSNNGKKTSEKVDFFETNVLQKNNGEALLHQKCIACVRILYLCQNMALYFRTYLVFMATCFEEVKSLCRGKGHGKKGLIRQEFKFTIRVRLVPCGQINFP